MEDTAFMLWDGNVGEVWWVTGWVSNATVRLGFLSFDC